MRSRRPKARERSGLRAVNKPSRSSAWSKTGFHGAAADAGCADADSADVAVDVVDVAAGSTVLLFRFLRALLRRARSWWSPAPAG